MKKKVLEFLNILFIVVLKMGLNSLFLSYIIGNSLVSLWLLFRIKVFSYVKISNLHIRISTRNS